MVNCKKGIAIILSLFFVFSVADTCVTTNFNECVPASTNTISEKVLIPDGRCIGVELSTDGVLVVGFMDIIGVNGEQSSPAKLAGLKPGDLIQQFSGKKISTVEELISAISQYDGKNSSLTITRNGNSSEVLITPITSQIDGTPKIGALVKDAATGIGTLTFYDPQTKRFAALGHGISDPETGKIYSVKEGSILSAGIVSVKKGEKGVPGELNGIFKNDASILGKISRNSDIGISGTTTTSFSPIGRPMPVGNRNDIKIGAAKILSTVNGNTPYEFDAKIIKIMPKMISHQKGFVVEITDEKLIEKTGGIVQGMSGSPILQDGKLIGAITHVFVNDPTKGYGIFIENMLSATK